MTLGRLRPDPTAIADIRPHVGRDIAAGRLYDIDGRPLTPLVGPGDTGADTDLTEPYRTLRFVHHVESNATAYMRRHHLTEAVLYINMRPCAGDEGCYRNLGATLPPGCRLTVYQVYPNGGIRAWRFTGTGEGIIHDRPG